MKKKIVALVGGLTMVALSVAFFANKSDAQTSLLMQNVEALANSELNPYCPNGCVAGNETCYCYGYVEHAREHDWGDLF